MKVGIFPGKSNTVCTLIAPRDGGGVERKHGTVRPDIRYFPSGVKRPYERDQILSEIGKDPPVAVLVRSRKGRLADILADTEMIEFASMCSET